jgi:hypothetical protein
MTMLPPSSIQLLKYEDSCHREAKPVEADKKLLRPAKLVEDGKPNVMRTDPAVDCVEDSM